MAVFPGCSCNDDPETTSSTSNPPTPVCGDGAVDSGETCDDGNTTAGDGCSPTCQTEGTTGECGDGTVDTGEQCDDGNLAAGDGCAPDCTNETQMPECGNGVVETGEECDDANAVAYDGCEDDCTLSPDEIVCENLTPLSSGTCEVSGSGAERLIKGNVLGRHTVLRGGQVLVDAAGMITCVGCDCAAMATAPTEIVCPEGVVSPGLINAHEHITFIQNNPYTDTGERYEHRHDWRRGNHGHTEIPAGGNASNDAKLWGELRYMMGGATSIIGSGDVAGLLRNLDRTAQEGLGQPPVQYDTFPLGDSNGTELENGCFYPSIATNAEISGLDAYFPHVAEGIAKSARNEFVCTETDANGGEDLLEPQSAYIHAVGLNPVDYVRMADQGTSLIWSPRSNITLYGDTAIVTAAARLGVNIALGTDWIPTGSMNLQRELHCADSFNQDYLDGFFTDRELWQMTTANAASAAAMDDAIGELKAGLVADIAIFDGATKPRHRAVIDAQPEDTVLVMRGGEVIYGDDALVQTLGTGTCDTIDVCGANKGLCAQNDFGKSYTQLATDVGGLYPLFFCGVDPNNEPSCHPMRAEANYPMYDGVATATDADGDGIADSSDNCPTVFNPVRPLDEGVQADADLDGEGDACDECPMDPGGAPPCSLFDPMDIDNDGILNAADNCPDKFNDTQADTDSDQKGDICDPCPSIANPGAQACPVLIQDIKQGLATGVIGVNNVLVTGCKTNNGYFLQTVMGDPGYVDESYTGIFVYSPTVQCGTTLSVGDRVSVNPATVSVFFDQIQLTFATPTIESNGNAAPTPVDVLPADAAGTLPNELEGVVVRVQNVLVTNDAPTPGPADTPPTNEFEVENSLRVNDFLHLTAPFPMIGANYTEIVGILDYRNGNQKLEPRGASDLVLGPPLLVDFSPATAFVYEGDTAAPTIPTPLTVTLSSPAQGDTFVSITSSDATSLTVVGGGVTVLDQQTTATVLVNGLMQSPSVTLSATLNTTMMTADVRVVGAAEQPAVIAVDPPTSLVPPTGSTVLTVTLDIPSDGINGLVSLSLSPGTFGTVPVTVNVPADQTSATFLFDAGSTVGMETVTATLGPSMAQASIEIVVTGSLVINEIDYDQIDADADEFVEIYNGTSAAVDMSTVSLALVNGSNNTGYLCLSLASAGMLDPGEFLVVGSTTLLATVPVGVKTVAFAGATNQIQNGAPDGVALFDTVTMQIIDALSYEGAMTSVTACGQAGLSLVEDTALDAGVADSNTAVMSLIRFPDGADSNVSANDWALTTTPTPGTANVQ